MLNKKGLIRTQLLIVFALLFFLSVPAFSGPADNDTVSKIVADYKAVELQLNSGQINQQTHKQKLFDLQVRADYLARKEVLDSRKQAGWAKPGETVADQKFKLTPPGNTEEEQIYLQILLGFTEQPT